MQRGNGPPWWRGAVIYQVYVRSFADGDGDGLGDLKGLIARLDHPRRLGVDALWLTPVHPSGGADGGYDVTDYLDVDPAYGDLHSFDRLVEASHARGLRILMDFVLNHTSDRHPWFVEARSSRASPRRGWYTFAGGSPGRPPNNWESAFGGPAWIREERTDQWSLSSFYPGQRDLNWANPGVRGVMGEAMRFWLDRGVDGFRLDALHRIAKDPHLRDNPQPVAQEGLVLRRDQNGPAIHRYVQDIRRAVGGEPLLLGEVWMPDLEEVLSYVKPGQLDLAFNFPFALSRWEPGAMAEVLERTEALTREAWPCYHLSNHDMPRLATRFGPGAIRPAAVLLLTLRGTAVLYQGEEIGMADGEVPAERRVDAAGRDGCRTPMCWTGGENGGFCPPGARPWLPARGCERVNVAQQEGDRDSVLSLYRRLIAIRRRTAALREGSLRLLQSTDQVLSYARAGRDGRYVVAVNFTPEAARARTGSGRIIVATGAEREGESVAGTCRLGPDEAVVMASATP